MEVIKCVDLFNLDGCTHHKTLPAEVFESFGTIRFITEFPLVIYALLHGCTLVVDEFDGIGDMERKCIRCVGKATERFEEDALRMLRGVRFAGQLQFEIERATFLAMKEKAPTIVNVSAERIRFSLI